MNRKNQHLFRALLLTGALALTAPQAALALTDACTKIDNTAHVSYKVGGVDQGPGGLGVDSNTASFYVGVYVDVIVTKTDNALPTSAPNNNKTINYSILNNGNAPMKYNLTAAYNAGASFLATYYSDNVPGTSNFDPGAIVSVNGTPGATYTTATINPGASLAIPVVVNIPVDRINNDITAISLTAVSAFPGTGGGTVTQKNSQQTGTQIGSAICTANATVQAANIDVVAADGAGTASGDAANDGKHSVNDFVKVTAAGLTIVKSSAPYWDPINKLVSPKAIPGAVMTYTITITNTIGAATATDIKVVDDLGGPITGGTLVFGNSSTEIGQTNTSFNDGTTNCVGSGAGYGVVVNGVCQTNANEDLDGGASWNDPGTVPGTYGATNKVYATGISVTGVAGGNVATVKYQVTIQ